MTRPNITYAVGVISRFMPVPTHAHIAAAYKVLRYLKNFLGKGLLYQKHGNHRVVAYTDADGAGSISDR